MLHTSFQRAIVGLLAACGAIALFAPQAASAASCSGSVDLGSHRAAKITATGLSCSSAKSQIAKGGVGAHGYERYGGWTCSDNGRSPIRVSCRKGSRRFAFTLKFATASSAATCMSKSMTQDITRRKNISCAAAKRVAERVYKKAQAAGVRVPECVGQPTKTVAGWKLRGLGDPFIATKMSKGSQSFVIGGGGAC